MVAFTDLVQVPHRERGKKRKKSTPSYLLSSHEHVQFIEQSTVKKNKKAKSKRDDIGKKKETAADENRQVNRVKKTQSGKQPKKQAGSRGFKKKSESAHGNESVSCANQPSVICPVCNVAEHSPEDKFPWILCHKCNAWLHEPCGEQFGILDDDYFTCQKCCI